jgi:hypothetical protein
MFFLLPRRTPFPFDVIGSNKVAKTFSHSKSTLARTVSFGTAYRRSARVRGALDSVAAVRSATTRVVGRVRTCQIRSVEDGGGQVRVSCGTPAGSDDLAQNFQLILNAYFADVPVEVAAPQICVTTADGAGNGQPIEHRLEFMVMVHTPEATESQSLQVTEPRLETLI